MVVRTIASGRASKEYYATSGARILFILCPTKSELDIELILVLLNFSCEFSSFQSAACF